MRLALFFLALICCAPTTAQSTPIPRTVEAFLTDPAGNHGGAVVLEGFLSLEDYAKALFTDLESYEASDFSQSVPVIIPNHILNHREVYERRSVRLIGTYDHDCARIGLFCSSHPGQGRIWVSSIELLPEQPLHAGWRLRDVYSAPHALEPLESGHPLLATAETVFAQIGQRSRTGFTRFSEDDDAEMISDELYDAHGRATWLLFSGEGAYASWMASHPEAQLFGFTLLNDGLQPPVGAACLCEDENCPPIRDLQADRVTNRNLADPYICLTFVDRSGGWQIDPGTLLSMRHMGDFGNDLGVMVEDDAGEGDTLVWRWVTTPGLSGAYFITRMRHQPRARIWHAMKTGEANIGIFVMRPDGQYWNMIPNDGNPEISLQARLPADAPDFENIDPANGISDGLEKDQNNVE